MLLLTLLQQLPDEIRPQLIVAHVNHQLRIQSIQEQDFLKYYCQVNHINFEATTWRITDHPSTGIEAVAHTFRYKFFEQVMKDYQAKVLVTAHHADDQIETILMKIIRGGDLTQLQGIAKQRLFGNGYLVRPFLSESKQTLLMVAKEAGISWYEDETNNEPITVRNELRNNVIPHLEKINPQFKNHLLDYRDQLNKITTMAMKANMENWPDVFDHLDHGKVVNWIYLSESEQRMMLRKLLIRHNLSVKTTQINEMVTLLMNRYRPQGQLSLTDSWQFVKQYDYFYITRAVKKTKKPNFVTQNMVVSKEWTCLVNSAIRVVPQSNHSSIPSGTISMTVGLSTADFPLVIRLGIPGDKIALKRGGHKTLRRILIDNHVSIEYRQSAPVVTTYDGEVLWILGIQRSARTIDPSQSIFQIQLNQCGKGEADE